MDDVLGGQAAWENVDTTDGNLITIAVVMHIISGPCITEAAPMPGVQARCSWRVQGKGKERLVTIDRFMEPVYRTFIGHMICTNSNENKNRFVS